MCSILGQAGEPKRFCDAQLIREFVGCNDLPVVTGDPMHPELFDKLG